MPTLEVNTSGYSFFNSNIRWFSIESNGTNVCKEFGFLFVNDRTPETLKKKCVPKITSVLKL